MPKNLSKLKNSIDEPLIIILTLNTIAHCWCNFSWCSSESCLLGTKSSKYIFEGVFLTKY